MIVYTIHRHGVFDIHLGAAIQVKNMSCASYGMSLSTLIISLLFVCLEFGYVHKKYDSEGSKWPHMKGINVNNKNGKMLVDWQNDANSVY